MLRMMQAVTAAILIVGYVSPVAAEPSLRIAAVTACIMRSIGYYLS